MNTRFARLFATSLFVWALLTPSVASAGDCTFQILPNPGYRGYNATIYGYGLDVGENYFINFNGNLVGSGTVPASGNVSATFVVSNDAPNPSNWIVFSDGECQMTNTRDYTVLNGPPPTTTIATTSTTAAPTTTTTTTTTSTTTTTTVPATTTQATTTTVAPSTTEASTTTTPATTTSSVDDTTTTTVADEGSGGGGVSTTVIVLIVLGVLLLIALIFALRWMRRS